MQYCLTLLRSLRLYLLFSASFVSLAALARASTHWTVRTVLYLLTAQLNRSAQVQIAHYLHSSSYFSCPFHHHGVYTNCSFFQLQFTSVPSVFSKLNTIFKLKVLCKSVRFYLAFCTSTSTSTSTLHSSSYPVVYLHNLREVDKHQQAQARSQHMTGGSSLYRSH